MLRAALYIRVSTAEQANKGYSLPAQKELLIRYCKDNDISVYKIFADEGKSANKALSKRTALLEMLSDAERGMFDLICFKDITRWSRSSSQYYSVQERLDKANVSWIAVDQPYLETRTPTGRFTVSIMLGTSQLESENISQRIRFVKDSMIRSKIVPYASRQAPFGYKVEIQNGIRRLIKDESAHAKDMFNYLLEYRNESRTRQYMLDTYGIFIASSFMSKIIHNPIYTGTYKGVADFTEPYITTEQFNELQTLSTSHFPRKKNSNEYIFKGIIRCEICGRTLIGGVTHYKKSNVVRYRCGNHYMDHQCPMNHYLRQDWIESEILKIIKPEFDKLKYKVEINYNAQNDQKAQLTRLKNKMKRLTEVYIEGSIDREAYTIRKRSLQEDIDKISQQEPINLDNLEKLLNSPWIDLYKPLNNEEKGRFFRSIIQTIWSDGKNITGIVFKYS